MKTLKTILFALALVTTAPAESVYVGISEDMQLGLSNQNSKLALNVLLKTRLRENGYELEFSTTSEASFAEQFPPVTEDGAKIDFFHLSSVMYHEMTKEERASITPVTFPTRGVGPYTEYLILGRPGTTLESVKGKTLYMCYGWDVGESWLDYEVSQVTGHPADGAESYFENLEVKVDPSDTILPLFFGKIDVCMTTRIDYELLCELNPQIKKLKVIKSSPRLIPFIGCIYKDDTDNKGRLVESLALSLHETPKGQQALSLLRLESFVPFDRKELEPTLQFLDQTKPVLEASVND